MCTLCASPSLYIDYHDVEFYVENEYLASVIFINHIDLFIIKSLFHFLEILVFKMHPRYCVAAFFKISQSICCSLLYSNTNKTSVK